MDAKKRAKVTIQQLGKSVDEGGVGWSEKTIRRAKHDGEIRHELLEALAKRLDVTSDYLAGEYDQFFEQIADGFNGKQKEAYLKVMLAPERYPYHLGQNKTKLYDAYMDGILMLHDIARRQYEELSPETQRQFALEIEQVVCPVISKYFDCDAMGRKGIPELYRIEAEIVSYGPEEPEAPNDLLRCSTLDRFEERMKYFFTEEHKEK
ncbi:MAG: hypothetical protein Q4P20_03260 [Eubacteriales bacterium]|nr:hypothetical protein [Eubacteriales bacterium]